MKYKKNGLFSWYLHVGLCERSVPMNLIDVFNLCVTIIYSFVYVNEPS